MARTKGSSYGKAGRRSEHIATFLTRAQRAVIEMACERDEITISEWVRRIVLAELGRLAVRTQLEGGAMTTARVQALVAQIDKLQQMVAEAQHVIRNASEGAGGAAAVADDASGARGVALPVLRTLVIEGVDDVVAQYPETTPPFWDALTASFSTGAPRTAPRRPRAIRTGRVRRTRTSWKHTAGVGRDRVSWESGVSQRPPGPPLL